jgi:hypothetical protein
MEKKRGSEVGYQEVSPLLRWGGVRRFASRQSKHYFVYVSPTNRIYYNFQHVVSSFRLALQYCDKWLLVAARPDPGQIPILNTAISSHNCRQCAFFSHNCNHDITIVIIFFLQPRWKFYAVHKLLPTHHLSFCLSPAHTVFGRICRTTSNYIDNSNKPVTHYAHTL